MGHEVVQVDTALYRPKNHNILVELALVNLFVSLSTFSCEAVWSRSRSKRHPPCKTLAFKSKLEPEYLETPLLLERLSRNLSKKVVALRVASEFV